MVSKNKIPYKTISNLNKFNHGFFSRVGGVSKGLYASLNCGLSSMDKSKLVKKNRYLISKRLGFEIENLIIANQYHSNKVKVFNKSIKSFKCDALINFDTGIALGVLTADCCPVIVGHKKNIMTGSLHIGWKGLYKGIIENFLTITSNNNIKPADLIFGLGPCINKNSYQVSEDFFDKFLLNDNKAKKFFLYKSKENGFYFDLKGYIKRKLNDNGIFNICISKDDTYKKNHLYYSYRYSCHNNLNDYGRMLSVIVKN